MVNKGTRIRAEWFGEAKPVALAGMQMKVQATKFVVTGVVRHIRGDHPTDPKVVRLYVESDDGTGTPCGKCQVREVEVNPDHVVEVLS
jgi:hypothetical protein